MAGRTPRCHEETGRIRKRRESHGNQTVSYTHLDVYKRQVYKLVSEGTIEEKIIAIQERKKELAKQVLEGEGMDSVSFTKEEILELLG